MSFCVDGSQPFSDAIFDLTSPIYATSVVEHVIVSTEKTYCLGGLGLDNELLLLEILWSDC